MRTLLYLLLLAALLALVGSVGVALLIRHAVRRLRRAARVRIGQARTRAAGGRRATDQQVRARNVSQLHSVAHRVTTCTRGSVLSTRAHLPGAGGAVHRVRRDLHRDVTATSRALRASHRGGRPVDGLDSCVAALVEQAQELQLNLQIVAVEPDRSVRARTLAAHADRAALIRRTCAQVRAAVLEEGSGSNEATLQRIVEDVNDAVMAASERARAYRELSSL